MPFFFTLEVFNGLLISSKCCSFLFKSMVDLAAVVASVDSRKSSNSDIL